MRLPQPRFEYPPEVYLAIIREHQDNPHQMGEFLMACGWSIGDAAWAILNWDLRTLAAAIACERAKRKVRLTVLPESDVAEIKRQLQAEKKQTAQPRPKRTTRIVPTLRADSRALGKSDDPPA